MLPIGCPIGEVIAHETPRPPGRALRATCLRAGLVPAPKELLDPSREGDKTQDDDLFKREDSREKNLEKTGLGQQAARHQSRQAVGGDLVGLGAKIRVAMTFLEIDHREDRRRRLFKRSRRGKQNPPLHQPEERADYQVHSGKINQKQEGQAAITGDGNNSSSTLQ